MNDQILSGYIHDFQTQHDLGKLDVPDVFSRFVTFCVLSKQIGSPVPLDDLDVDGGQDTGIDAIAVLINDRIVSDKEDVDFFRKSGPLNVEFVFIQSKMAAKFDSGDIGNFLFGVKNFFQAKPKVTTNLSVSNFREIKDYIYQNAIHLQRPPGCRVFYASTGKWTDDEYLSGRVESELNELRQTQLFQDVKFIPLDAERLKKLYRELRHRVEKEVLFEKHTILPKIDRANEAYLGILPSSEFLKLITDDEGEIQKSLFYDNVRDFQGSNPVNTEIATTLDDPMVCGSFVILNNGVTIVAKSIQKVGASFRIGDFQIVNGCQTSHVLHHHKSRLGNSVFVPVKLIVTDDPDLTNSIIKATNRQTEVKLEAFESLSPFHRTLEEFYASFAKEPDKRLYYERRSKQYANAQITPTSIITLAAQAKAFFAMFLNEPHSTHRYYGEILESNRDRLFCEDHSPFPYYASALALSRIEALVRANHFPRRLRPFKYHILLLFRLSQGGGEHPPFQGKKGEEFAKKLCDILWNQSLTLKHFDECANQLEAILDKFDGDRRQADRLRVFTNHLMPSQRQRPRGTVKYWNFERGFGFVNCNDGRDVFVHYTAIRESASKSLSEGQKVEFDIARTFKGDEARNLRVMS